MLKFDKEQRIFRIGDVEIGGQPGEVPTTLIGSIFHEGHGIVKDRERGKIDSAKAQRLISRQDKLSRRTGIPCMLDVVADTPKAMERNLSFAAGHTEAPLLVNGPSAAIRVHGMQHAKDIGVMDRAIYDSINYRIDDGEIESIRMTGTEAALIQAFNPANPMPQGMLGIIKGEEGLLKKAGRAGITKPILFAPVLDPPSIGLAAMGVHLLKSEMGLPSGTAPVGVIGRSKHITSMGALARSTSRSGAVALCQAMGSDFIIYGTIARAPEIFPACAVVDAAITYNARASGVRPRSARNALGTLYRG